MASKLKYTLSVWMHSLIEGFLKKKSNYGRLEIFVNFDEDDSGMQKSAEGEQISVFYENKDALANFLGK